MKVYSARHAWPEKKGFNLIRVSGHEKWSFLHFWQPVFLLVDDKLVETKPNAVLIYKNGTPQQIFSPSGDFIHDWFHFDGDNVEEYLEDLGIAPNKIYYPKNCAFLTETIKEIEGELLGEAVFCNEIMDVLLKRMFMLLSRRIKTTEEEYAVDYHTHLEFNALRNCIFSNLNQSWTITKMAEKVNLSESRFYVLYKAIFKTTPNQDLILARMEFAKRMLSQNTTTSIVELALECGYNNEFHFIRQFKKYVGMSPRQYALMYRNV